LILQAIDNWKNTDAHIGRNQTKGLQSPTDVKKIADALAVTPDLLIYGTSDIKLKLNSPMLN
jgi:hypothetical protein